MKSHVFTIGFRGWLRDPAQSWRLGERPGDGGGSPAHTVQVAAAVRTQLLRTRGGGRPELTHMEHTAGFHRSVSSRSDDR